MPDISAATPPSLITPLLRRATIADGRYFRRQHGRMILLPRRQHYFRRQRRLRRRLFSFAILLRQRHAAQLIADIALAFAAAISAIILLLIHDGHYLLAIAMDEFSLSA